MKKLNLSLLIFLVSISIAILSCSQEVHTHTYSTEWTSDANEHWHAATCEHTTEVSGKAAHSFGDWKVTQEPTEEAEGSREKSCTVCEYTVPEVIEKLEHKHKFATDWTKDETHHWYAATCEHTDEKNGFADHTFGEYVSNNDATTEADGTKTRECSVCGHEDTVTDEGSKIHVHTFAEEWTRDASGHWHAATCGHTTEVSGKAAHTFGEYVSNNDATTEKDGTKTRECSVCGHEDTVTDEGSKIHVHTFAEEWTSDSSGHWHAATCKHTDETSGFAEHTFGVYKVVQEPTDTQAGRNERTCKYCAYVDSVVLQPAPEGFVFVKGDTVTGAAYTNKYKGVFIEGRTVTLSDFYMGKYEVTQEEYAIVMAEQKVTVNGTEYALESNPSKCTADNTSYTLFNGDVQEKRPVEAVTWYDSVWYCNALSEKEGLTKAYNIEVTQVKQVGEKTGYYIYSANVTLNKNANGYRLPTEAEWEFAARGGDTTKDDWNYVFSGADTAEGVSYDSLKNAGLDSVGWYLFNSINGTTGDTSPSVGEQGFGTHQVGKKAPNRLGLYDMSGNAREWCYDRDGTITTTTPAEGADSGSYRVYRGGSWNDLASDAYVSLRSINYPYDRRLNFFGFRVVRPSSN